jgi:hypothetical protein
MLKRDFLQVVRNRSLLLGVQNVFEIFLNLSFFSLRHVFCVSAFELLNLGEIVLVWLL